VSVGRALRIDIWTAHDERRAGRLLVGPQLLVEVVFAVLEAVVGEEEDPGPPDLVRLLQRGEQPVDAGVHLLDLTDLVPVPLHHLRLGRVGETDEVTNKWRLVGQVLAGFAERGRGPIVSLRTC
jgi:hypothetical protein